MNKKEYLGEIELENGDYYSVFKVTSDDVYIEAGNVTNTGFISEFGLYYDEDAPLDVNIQNLFDHIAECRQQEADVRELLREF